MLIRLDDAHEPSIALVELRRDGMLLPLHPVADRTTHHGHVGT